VLSQQEKIRLPDEVYKHISNVHNTHAGHHGVERTIKKLMEKLRREHKKPWTYLREHVKQFIKQCPCCQKFSRIKTQIHTHPFTTASYQPMYRLNIDTINGLPVDDQGNRSLIVIIDTFSRWTEIYPTPNETAKVVASALLQHIVRYGCPSQIQSDNGPQFVNEIIEEFTKLIDTEYIYTLQYSKEENAMVERENKEVLRHLRNIIFDKNVIEKWSRDTIPFVQRIINSTVSSSTGASPAQILFGNALNLDHSIFLPLEHVNTTHGGMSLSAWTDQMISTQEAVLTAAAKSQKQKDDTHMAKANANRTEFAPHSYVLIDLLLIHQFRLGEHVN